MTNAVKPKKTILLVEDDRAVRDFMTMVLEDAGYDVYAAAHGPEAEKFASSLGVPIDLLVTDISMPLIGGREVAEALCAAQPGLKVLFVSGYFKDAILRRHAAASTIALLPKPFTATDLERRVKQVMASEPIPGLFQSVADIERAVENREF